MRPRRRALLQGAGAAGLSLLLPACGRETPGVPTPAPAQPEGALRIELRHALASGVESFALERLRAEPQWNAGRRKGPDPLGWGDYRVSVYDLDGGALLFQDGFDSSLELRERASTTRFSVRVPMPRSAVRAVIQKRRAGSFFQDVWHAEMDPRGPDVDRSPPAIATRVDTILSGPAPGAKAGIAILGDGYLESEYGKFAADAKRVAGYLVSIDPLKARVRKLDVWSVFAPSAESGVTDRYAGIEKKTVLGCRYGAGADERTLHAQDDIALREIASAVPYDFVLVLANSRRYGGSAYFGGPAVIAIDSAEARYLAIHEFAHVIGGLADEYYIPAGDGPAYRGNIEPWNPNVTISGAKWTGLAPGALRKETWNKADYDRRFAEYVRRYFALREKHAYEAEIARLMQAARAEQAALLAKNPEPRRVGLYEGGNGYAKGVFRTEPSCIMFSLQTDYFCAACTAAIERMIATRAA